MAAWLATHWVVCWADLKVCSLVERSDDLLAASMGGQMVVRLELLLVVRMADLTAVHSGHHLAAVMVANLAAHLALNLAGVKGATMAVYLEHHWAASRVVCLAVHLARKMADVKGATMAAQWALKSVVETVVRTAAPTDDSSADQLDLLKVDKLVLHLAAWMVWSLAVSLD